MISPLFFTKTVTLERPVVTKDTSGAPKRTFAAVAGTVPVLAAVQPLSAHAIGLFAARSLDVDHAVYTETDPGFQRGDRLAVSDGRYLSVEGLLDQAGAARVFKWACKELKA